MISEVEEDPHEDGRKYTTAEEEYKWFEMSVFTRWTQPDNCQVLCIDTPEDLPEKMRRALEKRSSSLDLRDPFAMHADLINQIIVYYDISIWRVRDPIRRLEKVSI